MTWCEKYRPGSFSELVGQEFAVEKVKRIVGDYNSGKNIGKKSLILYGPPGTGKTTIAYILAAETDSEIFELNASDLRNREKMQKILKPAIEQKPLTKKNKIILVDEVEGISTTEYGGLSELLELIDESAYPVIITANDIWDKKFSSLRQKCELIQLKEIGYKSIRNVLENIIKKEKLFMNQNILTSIAIRAKGDIRAAINDLQAVSRMRDPSKVRFDEREKELDIFHALKNIFKGKPTKETLEIFDSVNMSMDEIILWVDENLPYEYKGEELAKAYDRLSKTDVFKGRIYKQQYWRFLVYENILMSYGISSSKKDLKPGFTNYKKPSRILKIWMNNQKTEKKKTITQKYAAMVHIGIKRAMHEFPIIKQIINSNPQIAKELKLTEEELVYLKNGKD